MLPELADKRRCGFIVVGDIGKERRFAKKQKRAQKPDGNSAVKNYNKRNGAALIHNFAILSAKQKHNLRK